ncbi:MAG: hypothetical protein WAN65_26825 [Candidatus Sulfotelmatobacter sp.]
MLRRVNHNPAITGAVLAAALLVSPCALHAQRGGGGGHVGGGTAGGEGLSGVGKPTGVDQKDALRDFHEALAVQATKEQVAAFVSMLKSTSAASAELQTFQQELNKSTPAQEISTHGAAIAQAIENARSLNKLFLAGFSERQKTGLKETAKKLTKAEADLAQQTQALDQELRDAKASAPQLPSSAQTLDRALTAFQNQQLDLGKEMSIAAANNNQNFVFDLPPVKNSITLGSQAIAISTSGAVSKAVADAGQNSFKLELTTDLSDLRQNFTAALRAQLDRSNRCGERIAVQNATLDAQPPASLATVSLHYERWVCFGGSNNEIVEGNGTVEVKLTATVAEDGTLRIDSALSHINAEGLVGEQLRSGSLGDTVREQIAQSLLATMQRGSDFKLTLPQSAQGNATLHRAQFQGTASGKLWVILDGEIRVSNDKVAPLTSELQALSSSQALPELVPR